MQQQQTTKHGGTAARFLGRNRRWSRIFFAWRYSIYTALPPARWRERRSLGSWFGARTRGGGLRCTARDERSEKKVKEQHEDACLPASKSSEAKERRWRRRCLRGLFFAAARFSEEKRSSGSLALSRRLPPLRVFVLTNARGMAMGRMGIAAPGSFFFGSAVHRGSSAEPLLVSSVRGALMLLLLLLRVAQDASLSLSPVLRRRFPGKFRRKAKAKQERKCGTI